MMKKITKIVNILCMNILQSYNFFLSKTSTISQSFHLSICLLDFCCLCFCLCFNPVLVEYSISHKFSVSPILELFVEKLVSSQNTHFFLYCFPGYKPFIISRDEEPVQIQNACGEVIPVPGHYRVLFDTGNEVATSISRKCLLELNLQPDPSKKRKVKLAGGGSGQFETVDIELIIRGYHFKVCALIDAVAEGTDLLVGMDIIQKLFNSGYTIGD